MRNYTIGKCIKEARLSKEYTLKELGEILGVSHAYLSKLENDITKPNLEMISKISEILDYHNEIKLYETLMILSGHFDDSIKGTDTFNKLKEAGRIEILSDNDFNILPNQYYLLNYILNTHQSVFYEIEVEPNTYVTIELPSTLKSKLNNHIQLIIQEEIQNNPNILINRATDEALKEYEKVQHNNSKALINSGFAELTNTLKKFN